MGDPKNLVGTPEHKIFLVRAFFTFCVNGIKAIYMDVNGNDSGELTPEKWNRFVNSKKLYDMAYMKVFTFRAPIQETIAYSEAIESLGMEIITENQQIFIAIPVENYGDVSMITDPAEATRQQATRAFITVISHLLFKVLYDKPFVIFNGQRGFRIDDDLDYVII